MRFSDEVLMAYADGELDLVARAEIEAAIATEPEVARAVERHRALRVTLHSAYAGVLAEAVPDALKKAVDPPAAKVVDLAARRAAPAAPPPRRWALPEWSAMAASVTIGLMVGLFVLRQPASPVAEQDGALLARGELAQALQMQLASAGDEQSVRVGLSFRNRDGDYCRTFVIGQQQALAGLACRDAQDWKIGVMAAAAVSEDGGVRTAAASMPAAVLRAVDAAIDGEPLNADAEMAARDSGWRQAPAAD